MRSNTVLAAVVLGSWLVAWPAGAAPSSPVADSLPSPTALRVLARIPEPVPADRVVAPAPTPARRAAAPEAAYDTLRTGDVPVPSPTTPFTPPPPPVVLPPEPAAPVAPTAPAAPAAPADGSCWRVQFAAPADSTLAASRREAAQSLLLVAASVEFERGLYKVRSRDCMTREAADAVKRRATESGFEGVFLLDASVRASEPPATKPAPKRKTRRGTSR
ncbi:MAG: hypothetical protein ACKO3S_08860 [bacterium]